MGNNIKKLCRYVLIICFLTSELYSYSWPINIEKKINSTFGEFRSSSPVHYHAGVDISSNGKAGVTVTAVVGGQIMSHGSSTVEIRGDDGVKYIYRHVSPTAPIGKQVKVNEKIGETAPYEYGAHIHLEELHQDGLRNPLRVSYGLEGYNDDYNAVICPLISSEEPFEFYPQGKNNRITDKKNGNIKLSGQVDIIAAAADRQNDANKNMCNFKIGGRTAPYKVCYKLENEQGQTVISDTCNIKFDLLDGTQEWKPRNGLGLIYDTKRSTNSGYYYWITNKFNKNSYLDTTKLTDGKYSVIVYADDYDGGAYNISKNIGSETQTVYIENGNSSSDKNPIASRNSPPSMNVTLAIGKSKNFEVKGTDFDGDISYARISSTEKTPEKNDCQVNCGEQKADKTYSWSKAGSYTVHGYIVDKKGNSDSVIWNVTVTAPNQAPTQPGAIRKIDSTTNSIKISWISSTDSDGDISRYYVEYSKGWLPDGWNTCGSTSSTSIPCTNLSSDSEYEFRVRARDNDGEYSGWKESNYFDTKKEVIPLPTINDINPSPITAKNQNQDINIIGNNFSSSSKVEWRSESYLNSHTISNTTYINSSKIKLHIKVTSGSSWWEFRVKNGNKIGKWKRVSIKQDSNNQEKSYSYREFTSQEVMELDELQKLQLEVYGNKIFRDGLSVVSKYISLSEGKLGKYNVVTEVRQVLNNAIDAGSGMEKIGSKIDTETYLYITSQSAQFLSKYGMDEGDLQLFTETLSETYFNLIGCFASSDKTACIQSFAQGIDLGYRIYTTYNITENNKKINSIFIALASVRYSIKSKRETISNIDIDDEIKTIVEDIDLIDTAGLENLFNWFSEDYDKDFAKILIRMFHDDLYRVDYNGIIEKNNASKNIVNNPVGNKPSTPSVVSPSNNAIDISLTPTVSFSPFSDMDGDSHIGTWFEIRRVDDKKYLYDSGWINGATSAKVIASLDYDTEYQIRVRYEDSRRRSDVSRLYYFTTLPAPKPKVTTIITTALIAMNEAMIGAMIDTYKQTNTKVYFNWGTNRSMINQTSEETLTDDLEVVIIKLENLECDTTYFMQPVAENSKGSTLGERISFATKECQAEVEFGTGLSQLNVVDIPDTEIGQCRVKKVKLTKKNSMGTSHIDISIEGDGFEIDGDDSFILSNKNESKQIYIKFCPTLSQNYIGNIKVVSDDTGFVADRTMLRLSGKGVKKDISDAKDSDLYFDKVEINKTTVSIGEKVSLYAKERYSGSIEGEVKNYIGYFLSKDKTFDKNKDTLLGEDEGVPSNKFSSGKRETVTIPDSVIIGDYYILFVADYKEQYNETNEDNNVEYKAITIEKSEQTIENDFYIRNTNLSTTTMKPLDIFTLNSEFRYSGTSTALLSPKAIVYLSKDSAIDGNDKILFTILSSIKLSKVQDKFTFSDKLRVPANTETGNYYILVKINYENNIQETNIGNNIVTIPISIKIEESSIDSDNDGIADDADNCPSIANYDQADLDTDGVGNVCDDDRDGDETPNTQDVFPDDVNESIDSDSDGIGNNTDTDDDNDGISDVDEINYGLNPLDSSDAILDNDGDGVSNLDEINAGTDPNMSETLPKETATINLQKGFNLISLPMSGRVFTNTLNASITRVTTFDADQNLIEWKKFATENDLKVLVPFKGYFVQTDKDTSITYLGVPFGNDDKDSDFVLGKWNILGSENITIEELKEMFEIDSDISIIYVYRDGRYKALARDQKVNEELKKADMLLTEDIKSTDGVLIK